MDVAEQGKYALDINSTAAKLLWALSKRESREGQSVKEVSSTLWWRSVKSGWVKNWVSEVSSGRDCGK